MIELPITSQGKGRIWLQELPDCSYSVSQVLERRLPAEPSQHVTPLCAALEVFVPRGGFCPYGLLGARFVPAQSGELVIQVAASSSNGPTMINALIGSIDEVSCGLPMEYATGVLEGAAGVDALPLLGSGMLFFDCAAHGVFGSSFEMFSRIAELVVQFLPLRAETSSPDVLKSMIEFGISSRRKRPSRGSL